MRNSRASWTHIVWGVVHVYTGPFFNIYEACLLIAFGLQRKLLNCLHSVISDPPASTPIIHEVEWAIDSICHFLPRDLSWWQLLACCSPNFHLQLLNLGLAAPLKLNITLRRRLKLMCMRRSMSIIPLWTTLDKGNPLSNIPQRSFFPCRRAN